MHCALPDESPTLHGRLNLVCSSDPQQRTYIRTQSFSAPFHISKPHWDGKVLVLQIVNPTAGLFAGDKLESEIRVETEANFLVTTPSASRIHTSKGGWAEVRQQFHVSDKAWLEYSPAMLIPQVQGKYRQFTDIHIEKWGELFFFETLAPGRVAGGESFQYEEIDWESNLHLDNILIARERFFLRPDNHSILPLRKPFTTGYYASGYLITDRITPDSPLWTKVHELNSDQVLLGTTRLLKGGWSIKLLAENSITLKKTLASLRLILSENLPQLKTIPRML